MRPHRRDRIAGYATSIVACTTRLRDCWVDGEALVHEAMMALTLAIAGKTLFDADIEDEAREISAALGHLFNSFNRLMLPWNEAVLVRSFLQHRDARWFFGPRSLRPRYGMRMGTMRC